MMIPIAIDGKSLEVPAGTMILKAAQSAGIAIPTLCIHDAVEPFGACRVCLVEITKPKWDGWSKLVTSCLYPVEPDLIVYTRSPKVLETRKTIIDLLLARAPSAPRIQELAREHGIYQSSFPSQPGSDNCILCGLCTRICDHLGISAIATVNRGAGKEIATPFHQPSDVCIGCLACANICPTAVIQFKEDAKTRTIWDKTFNLAACEKCGKAFITEEQLAYEIKKSGLERSYFTTCDACKREHIAGVFREFAGWQRNLEAAR